MTWNFTEYNESLPGVIDIWIDGGDFFISRDMGWDTSFVSTLAEFHTTHSLSCPTPDGFSWKRLGAGDVKLHVSLNGQEPKKNCRAELTCPLFFFIKGCTVFLKKKDTTEVGDAF